MAAAAAAAGAAESAVGNNEDVPNKKIEAVFIDFDDTLSPSTWISKQAVSWTVSNNEVVCDCPDDVRAEMALVDEKMVNLVRRIMESQYRLVIVTNSEEGWVSILCKHLMPQLQDLINASGKEIKVVSARQRYGETHPLLPPAWKAMTFFDELHTLGGGAPEQIRGAHLVCVGDGIADRLAALTLVRVFPSIIMKSVKLVDSPNPTQLSKQARFLQESFEMILSHKGSMDVQVFLPREGNLSQAGSPASCDGSPTVPTLVPISLGCALSS
jgi:hypothetical protein